MQRLARRHTEAEAQAAFGALGWPSPPVDSARYNAVYGTVEVRPDRVLRAAIALTGILAGQPHTGSIPHLVTRTELIGGGTVAPLSEPLAIDALAAAMPARVQAFFEQVLGAPYAIGTLRELGWLRSDPGIAHLWGKTGTADGLAGRTRTVWETGGFTYRGRPMSFVTVVAGSNHAPLGQIEAGAVSPLTSIVLRHALSSAVKE